MADQKAMKKRLKALMRMPENQVCSDCPEKRPTWASLIVPPPGAPPGTEKLGSFMCLECSGSHRRLGVHITFVRSVNLDAWKEWEVRAMENGGNAKINAIFEAKLAQSGRKKLTNLADGPTRERYIRDKYERRKFYDPAGFAMQSNSGGAPVGHSASGGGDFSSPSRPGAPSDVARRRVANRQARMKPPTSTPVAKAPPVKVTQAPVSAPVEFDLLDFGSDATATATTTTGDAFSPKPVVSTPSAVPKSAIPPPPKTAPPTTTSATLADELLKNPAPATKTTTSNDDIMSLFAPSKQQQNQQAFGFGMQAMNQMAPNASQQAGFNNQQNMMSQQQRQQMMMMQNNNMMNGNQMMPNQMMSNQMMSNQMMTNQMMPNQMMPNQMMSNQMMPNQMMQQQQMQQQQMMMQKQMMMQQQQQKAGSMNNMGMYGSSANNGNNNFFGGVSNGNNMNQTMQGMQNMSLGNGATRQSSDDGGFGTPMGGGPQQQSMKSDAFSSLGGMNAFR